MPRVDRQNPAVDRLTPTERDILQAFADGFTSREVADLSGISYHTIRTHRGNILTKLHCHTITSAVMLATRSGVIE